MITIFTPTYNRANLLPRIYNSLKLQTNKNFEWLVVDDGSTDNTECIFRNFMSEEKMPLRYYKKVNGGKNTAINMGVTFAKGEYILILDSDDRLTPDAIAFVSAELEKISRNDRIAGVAGRRIYENGCIVGRPILQTIVSNSLNIRYRHHITGDLVEIFKTNVLKEFPFPEHENEKFCPEVLVWNRIAQQYDLVFTNKGFYITEYLPGGITDNMFNTLKESPIATTTTYAELSGYDIPLWFRIRACINYWRYSFYLSDKFVSKFSRVNPLLSLIGLPTGALMFIRDKTRR